MLTDNKGEDAQELSISQHEPASICGLSRQRVNVVLSILRQEGLVRHEPGTGTLLVHVPRLRNYLIALG